jgi:hypothetical protein
MPEENVTKIITNTRAVSIQDWETLIRQYQKVYWKGFRFVDIIELLDRLKKQNKIIQPRIDNSEYYHKISAGVWIEDDEVWQKYSEIRDQ